MKIILYIWLWIRYGWYKVEAMVRDWMWLLCVRLQARRVKQLYLRHMVSESKKPYSFYGFGGSTQIQTRDQNGDITWIVDPMPQKIYKELFQLSKMIEPIIEELQTNNKTKKDINNLFGRFVSSVQITKTNKITSELDA